MDGSDLFTETKQHVVHTEPFKTVFKDLVNNPKMSDVTFVVGTKKPTEIHSHRLLAAVSPVFNALLFGSMKESFEKKVVLKDVEAQDFILLLEYIYTHEVIITPSNVTTLLQLSNMYDLAQLKTDCTIYLNEHVTSSSALDLLCSANILNVPQIAQNCMELICTETKAALSVKSFVDTPLETLQSIFQQDKLTIEEIDLFTFAIQWLKHNNPDGNKEITNSVMKYIKFTLIPPEHLVLTVKQQEAFTKLYIPMDQYLEALEFYAAPTAFDKNLSKFNSRFNSGSLCRFKSIGDNNGILNQLATNFGKQTWKNPMVLGLVTVTSSIATDGEITQFVSNCASGLHIAANQKGTWIMLEFLNHLIEPDYYCLWPHYSDSIYYMRNWRFEGSMDKNTWVMLREHVRDETIIQSGKGRAWPLKVNEYFK